MKPKLFYLDDQKINTLVLKRVFSEHYNVSTFNNFEELEKVIVYDSPDVFLLDILMPDINGIDVARILRHTERFAMTPIVMLTAIDNVEELVRCFNVGVNDFLVKPPNYAELKARIDAAIIASKRHLEYAADRRFETLKSMIQGFNHEFNNHLTILQSGVEILKMLLEDKGYPEAQRIDVILQTINRSSDLLRELLAITAFSRERLNYSPLRFLLDDLIKFSRSYMQEANIDFQVIELKEPADGFLRLNTAIFCKIFTALFSNAIDSFYGLENQQKKVILKLDVWESILHITVEDNGCGVPTALQTRVFVPFFTTKGSLGGQIIGDKVNGTGLGLTFVESVVRESGGTVRIGSAEPQGTKVIVSLPILPHHDGSIALAEPHFEIPRVREHLLVALFGCSSSEYQLVQKYLSVQGCQTLQMASKNDLLNIDYDAVVFSPAIQFQALSDTIMELQALRGAFFPIVVVRESNTSQEECAFFRARNCCVLLTPFNYSLLMKHLNNIFFV